MTDAQVITLALIGRWHGRYGIARCPAHSDRRPSLSLRNGKSGRLLAHCHAGCSFTDVLDALRARGIVSGSSGTSWSAQDHVRQRALEEAEATRRVAQARCVWDQAVPIAGTVAEAYLRARGICCDLPPTLRFQAKCWHLSAQRLPALVALVEGAHRFAIHRTYLRADGRGQAEVEPAKAMLGGVSGGAVRLWQAADQPDHLAVAEGIETALSLASGLLRRPATIWAALSTSGMRSLRLPDTPGALTITSDGDAAGYAAAHALAVRAHDLGWQVHMLPAPAGKDWNDVLNAKREGETS